MRVHVEGLVFAGVGAEGSAELARFLSDALGATLETDGAVNLLRFPNGSAVAVVPPDYVGPPSDTLLGFLVDDVEAATQELAAKGVDPDGDLQTGYGFRYRPFRAPDGRRFELLDRRV
jgi:hypothetical protein